jgi:hypothetical protein
MYKYIENALRPSSLLLRFHNLPAVDRRLKTRNEYVTTKEQERDLPSFLELQGGKFEELEKIYRYTFRELFNDLEKIRTD